jgi:hypothetical protein
LSKKSWLIRNSAPASTFSRRKAMSASADAASGWISGWQEAPMPNRADASRPRMKAASSAELRRPPGGDWKSGSPRGGSPRRARTLSIPASSRRSRIASRPSIVSPTTLRCAIVSIP